VAPLTAGAASGGTPGVDGVASVDAPSSVPTSLGVRIISVDGNSYLFLGSNTASDTSLGGSKHYLAAALATLA